MRIRAACCSFRPPNQTRREEAAHTERTYTHDAGWQHRLSAFFVRFLLRSARRGLGIHYSFQTFSSGKSRASSPKVHPTCIRSFRAAAHTPTLVKYKFFASRSRITSIRFSHAAYFQKCSAQSKPSKNQTSRARIPVRKPRDPSSRIQSERKRRCALHVCFCPRRRRNGPVHPLLIRVCVCV